MFALEDLTGRDGTVKGQGGGGKSGRPGESCSAKMTNPGNAKGSSWHAHCLPDRS